MFLRRGCSRCCTVVALETPSKTTLAAFQVAAFFVMLASGGVLFLLFGSISLYFHWRDLQEHSQHPPLNRSVLERFMQKPVSGTPDESRIRKLQDDYDHMVEFRRSTLIGALGFDVFILATGFIACSLARPKKLREELQIRRGPHARKSPNFVQQDPSSRLARLSLLAGSVVILAGGIFALIHFRIETARVQDSPPLETMTLDFYMPEPARGSADAVTVRNLQRDYAILQESHLRHLKATLFVLVMPFFASLITMLWQLMWLWQRKTQPQPQIENTPAA